MSTTTSRAKSPVIASLKELPDSAAADRFVRSLSLPDRTDVDPILESLRNGGLPVEPAAAAERAIISGLASAGMLYFKSAANAPALLLMPVSPEFVHLDDVDLGPATWKMSRFCYLHERDGEIVLRNPMAHCSLRVEDPAVLSLLFQFRRPARRAGTMVAASLREQADSVFALLARAQAILPCDAQDQTVEETDPAMRQWQFQDLLFHTSSRTGRSEHPIGGTFRFQGVLPPQPAVKPNPWHGNAIPLAVPNLQELFVRDMPLTAALETRCSGRSHSLLPLTLQQLGELLYRTLRNRRHYVNEYGEFVSRPHPCGGALYEDEIYVTISACVGIARGLYYYDPQHHTLSLVRGPCPDLEGMLDEAWLACARLCRPQILLTIASRFTRFHWKYSGMSYAAQLKNVGVIYQTLYLVATAMNIAACGLGTGNADRFARITGLPYLEEGSVGEFMLGRPL